MFLIEGVLGSKNLFSESCSQRPYYYREVISVFWFGGSKTRLPSPEGGWQMKSCSDQKTYLAKVDRSAHITIEKWSRFFDLGGPRLVCLPPKGEGKRKVARIEKLVYESWSERPSYYREVTSVFWFDLLWRKTTFDGRRPLTEDNLWRKTTFDPRQSSTEDNIRQKTTFGGRRPFIEDNP